MNVKPAESHLIKPRQVSPLPVGPGGKSQLKQQLNDTNVQLTMLTAQSTANTKYDPPVPKPITKQVTLETFCVSSTPVPIALGVVGALCIVYGLIAK
jgi:hypothetical protein